MVFRSSKTAWKIVTAIFLIVVVSLFVYVSVQKSKLKEYRRLIESRYETVFSLIENRARVIPTYEEPIGESFDRATAILDELKAELTKPEVFSALWSIDGHHNIEALKQMDTNGFSLSGIIASQDATGNHSLYFGRTFEGVELLIYRGWVPDAVMKSYDIAFYRSAIDAWVE